ncbi:thiolase family protein [Arthrobacter mobilis]|uniref:Thiolase family protein n=1 Tax=Arthrobacter mobilis TaxID=2724944 RepID=A0A7X6HB92_9MICC|nr:thiolase family protein [Arthrobacter mobilis]NKX53877.1 thiolase family protein [Arthrobacter mobilis]
MSTFLASPDPHRDPVIVLGRRSAFGRLNGMWRGTAAAGLLAPVLSAVVRDAGLPAGQIDDVVIGNAVGGGGNLARLALLEAGLPDSVPGVTVDRQCGSGLDAIVLACRLVASGAGQLYLAGGVESCSTAPLRAHRLSSAPGAPDFYARSRFSPEAIGDPDMGVAAEAVAARWDVSRADQDTFALASHRRAAAAAAAGVFAEEIVPAAGIAGSAADEGPRGNLGPELLRRFPAAFVPSGTVTAGNSCADADGAAVVLVASRAAAARLGFGAGLGFLAAGTAGTDPNFPGIGGGRAGARLLAGHGLRGADLDRVEFNEAFAAQALASLRMLGVDPERANLQGGALAFGHPYGASGAFLVLRLLQQCRGRDGGISLAAASIAGGMGTAALFGWTDCA